MSRRNLPLPGNNLTLDDVTQVVSSSAIVRAMQKVNMDYEPSDKEKLDEVLTHPELLARAVGMIVSNKTDKEIAEVLDIKPFTVGFIRENEFVRILCDECFQESINNVKNGLSKITMNAIQSLANLVDPEKDVADKTRYMASTAVINTVLKLNGEFKSNSSPQTVNVTQINNNIQPDAKEAYERAVRDMSSIIPVAENIYGGEDNGIEETDEPEDND